MAAPALGAGRLLTPMPILSTRSLCKQFGGLRALDGVDLDLEPGEILGVIGPNGAGKTTLFSLISGSQPPSSGQVLLDGKDVGGKAAYRMVRAGVVRTHQIVRPFPNLSVAENVAVGAMHAGRRASGPVRDRAGEVLDFVGLADRARSMPGTLTLAGRKRLELARALVARPRLVLLDEPVAGLNASETDAMGRALVAARQEGVGLVLVEHDMALVMKISDQVVVLSFGQKIAQGNPHQVQNDPRVLSTYLGGREEPVNGNHGHGQAERRAARA